MLSDERNLAQPVKPDLSLLLLRKPHETSLLELKSPKLNVIIQHIHWIRLSKVLQNKAKAFFFFGKYI